MNWGWSGIDNGYFQVGSLNPGSDNFNSGDEVLIGIQPPSYLAINNVPTDFSFSLFPIPARNKIAINSSEINPVYYVIFDELGNGISRGIFVGTTNTIDVNNLTSGVYFIRLQNCQNLVTHKFLIEGR
jgi:hypothetical protein